MIADQIVVIGGGSAALCAAIAARRAGARVTLIERAPQTLRGGNTRHARNFRLQHPPNCDFSDGDYSAQEFADDLSRATQGSGNPELTARLITESAQLPAWLHSVGVRLQTRRQGRLPVSRKTAFLLGGGKALINALYGYAAGIGVNIEYDCTAAQLHLHKNRVTAITLNQHHRQRIVQPQALILASGGAQANRSWLAQHWGERADGLINRGTPYAQGELLLALLAAGAQAVGDPQRAYLVAVDARSPPDDGGIITRIRAMPEGIVVNRDGERFHDESADSGSTRYALWGRLVADCPGQIAYLLLDSRGICLAPPTLYPPLTAPTMSDLAAQLALPVAAVERSLMTDHAAAHHPLPLSTPPFAAYPIRPGITFTYHGLAVDTDTRVRLTSGQVIDNLFAAGTIMAPNLCPQGYLSGLMLSISLVFGRLAGEAAAGYVNT